MLTFVTRSFMFMTQRPSWGHVGDLGGYLGDLRAYVGRCGLGKPKKWTSHKYLRDFVASPRAKIVAGVWRMLTGRRCARRCSAKAGTLQDSCFFLYPT